MMDSVALRQALGPSDSQHSAKIYLKKFYSMRFCKKNGKFAKKIALI